MRMNKRGEMGVGTMIVFIAVVLVAAVAASVIIYNANVARERAAQTGNDAITGVSTGFDVDYVTGNVTDNKVDALHVYLRLSAGSQKINADNIMVEITTSGSVSMHEIGRCHPTDLKVVDNRAELIVNGLAFLPGDRIALKIIPMTGFPTTVEVTVPDVLVGSYVSLS